MKHLGNQEREGTMASKKQKHPPSRQSGPRKRADPLSEIQRLKKRVAELRKKLKYIESERDAYLRVTHAYMRLTENPEEIASGFNGEFIEGSLVGFLKQAEKECKLKSAKGKKAS